MYRKGFTLLELLIVVIVIGILAAIALPQYMSTIERSKAGEAMANIGAIRSSLDRYWYESGGDLSGATLPDSADENDTTLDINNPNAVTNKLYTYSISGLSASGDRAYTVTATRTARGETYNVWWIQTDNNTGALYKSTNLGGSGLP